MKYIDPRNVAFYNKDLDYIHAYQQHIWTINEDDIQPKIQLIF